MPFNTWAILSEVTIERKGVWNSVVDAVRNRLSNWNNKHILISGRIVLKKSASYALCVYLFTFFKAPLGIISKLGYLF